MTALLCSERFRCAKRLFHISSRLSEKIIDSSFKITVDDFSVPSPNFNIFAETKDRKFFKPKPSYDVENGKEHSDNETRYNGVNIQMLSNNIYKQIFGNDRRTTCKKDVNTIIEELKTFGLWNSVDHLPDVNLNLPPLDGKNIEDHFWNIGMQQSQPYKVLLEQLAKANDLPPPVSWLHQEGWTKYAPDAPPERVLFPNEECLVFDIEVCRKAGEAPTLATAMSPTAWYGWVSPILQDSSDPVPIQHFVPDHFIPLEGRGLSKNTPRVVIGHNVSYDRARVKEQYRLDNSALRFFDTMSMHICIGGITSYQRAMLKAKVNVDNDDWREYSSLNSLREVYKLYLKEELSKETRDIFVEGNISEVKENFQHVMKYCASDVIATHKIFKKMLPLFFERFPHPVTLAGMLEMGTAFLPINPNWERYLADSQQTYEDLEKECKFHLIRKSDNACQLLHEEKYREDLWMWDEDWSTQELKMTKKKIKVENEMDNEEDDDLYAKFKHLFEYSQKLPVRIPNLPGYPLWYRKLCEKPDHPDWVPGPQLVSTSVKVAPKILQLTWERFPVHHTREHGWGILVADLNADDLSNNNLPLARLKALTKENGKISGLPNDTDVGDLQEEVDKSNAKYEYWRRHKSDTSNKNSGPLCDHVQDGCYFIKLPHKDGPSNNVGNPLAKDFMKTFSSSVLAGADEVAEKVLDIGRKLSYWRNNRERITGQIAVWRSPNLGAIIPQVVVCGTLTRRAMERTWMTASNAQTQRVGSELRSMVQAPPGYHMVGADVDSQELWIASVIGDAAFAGIHGSTPFGRMTLIGTKASGTDMHSVTAAAAGISRDHAKVINYARIYGAGVRFAQRLLKQFNPEMTDIDAKQKAVKMFLLTKGYKLFQLKNRFRDQLPENVEEYHTAFSAAKIARTLGKPLAEIFESPKWKGGTESAMFNRLEEIACSPKPRTPFLSARLSRAVEPQSVNDDSFMTTRVNWVVQSGAVDFLHLMLVSLRWLSQGKMRFCLSFHDEVRYIVPSKIRYEAALALHITNLLTRAFCVRRLGMYDLPQSVAFFASVEVDTVLRKEARDDCQTPSNPHGLEKGYGVPPGESIDIHTAIAKTSGTLKYMKPAGKTSQENKMSKATKRKHVISEILHQEPVLPQPNQQIVQVTSSKGNYLLEVESPDGTTFLVSMPVKFRNNVWVKRGDYILVEPIDEGEKVKAEMVLRLTPQYIRFFKASKVWPDKFGEDENDDDDQEDDLFENPNRPQRIQYGSSTDSSEEG